MFTYTQDQSKALDRLIEWSSIPQEDAPIFRLTGAAGTGKTTMLDKLIQQYDDDDIAYLITAPTHKARLVLGDKIGKETVTLQKALGFSPDVDLEKPDALRKFKPRHKPMIEGHDVILIDEASMISEDMFMFLRQKCDAADCKIIFAGDKFQLPPVGEDTAIALANDDKHRFELKEIVRQAADSPLSVLLLAMRNDIYYLEQGGIDNDILTPLHEAVNQHYPHLLSHIQSYAFKGYATDYLLSKMESTDFITLLEDTKSIAPLYVENPERKILLFKNASVDSYNRAARRLLGYNGMVQPGELLMGYRNITVEETVVLINGLEYRVRDINGPYTIDSIPYHSASLTPQLRNAWDVTVRITDHNAIPQMFVKSLQLVNAAQLMRKWDAVHAFHNSFTNMMDMTSMYKNTPMPKGYQSLKHWQLPPLALKYGYAMTIHKSQGSTYDEVIIDLNDLPLHRKDKEGRIFALKLLYVAVSRARHRVILVKRSNDLAD